MLGGSEVLILALGQILDLEIEHTAEKCGEVQKELRGGSERVATSTGRKIFLIFSVKQKYCSNGS